MKKTEHTFIKKSKNEESTSTEIRLPEDQNLGNQKFENEESRGTGTELPEVQNLGIKKFKNQTSGSIKSEPQEVQKLNPNYNNNSYTDMSYINPSNQSNDPDGSDRFDESAILMSVIKENIEYDNIMQNQKWKDRELYEELFELICEVVCVKRKTVRIGGGDYPYELVKSKFMKLNSSHLLYVIECMQNTTSRVTNI